MRICLFLYERLHLRMFNLQSKIIIFLICVICGENCGEKKIIRRVPGRLLLLSAPALTRYGFCSGSDLADCAGTNSIWILLRFRPCRLCFGMSIRLKPNFSASLMRCSMRFTGRISPLSPTSPAMQTPVSISVSMLLERMACCSKGWR